MREDAGSLFVLCKHAHFRAVFAASTTLSFGIRLRFTACKASGRVRGVPKSRQLCICLERLIGTAHGLVPLRCPLCKQPPPCCVIRQRLSPTRHNRSIAESQQHSPENELRGGMACLRYRDRCHGRCRTSSSGICAFSVSTVQSRLPGPLSSLAGQNEVFCFFPPALE